MLHKGRWQHTRRAQHYAEVHPRVVVFCPWCGSPREVRVQTGDYTFQCRHSSCGNSYRAKTQFHSDKSVSIWTWTLREEE